MGNALRGAIGIIEGLPRPYRLDVRAMHGAVAQADKEQFLAHCQYENVEHPWLIMPFKI